MARRAGQAREAYRRSMRPSPEDTSSEQQPLPEESSEETQQPDLGKVARNKYTVTLTDDDALMWDDVAMRLRRQLGRKVSKSEIVRALVGLAADDPTLLQQIAETVQQHDGTT